MFKPSMQKIKMMMSVGDKAVRFLMKPTEIMEKAFPASTSRFRGRSAGSHTELNQDVPERNTSRLEYTQKAMPYPDGTPRRHNGKRVQKTEGKWVRVKVDSSQEGKVLRGTVEMYNALHDIQDDDVYLDDLHGDEKKIFDRLTKLGLVKWGHAGSDEYVAELTDKGRQEFRRMKAIEQKYARMAQSE